jgi:tetratricopeptide (TPR) repeat protein
MTQASEKPFLQRIWEKGIVQVIFSYLLGAWALLQFIDWMVNRYGISTEWTDLALLFLVMLLPSVILYTYYQNIEKSKTVKMVEKYVIPSNLVIALIFVFFMVPTSSDASASEEKITVTNEEGEKIERFIPKKKFTKRIMLFPAITESEETDWMQFMYPALVSSDLRQDNRISTISAYALDDDIKRFGFKLDDEIPIGIQRKIAEDSYTDYFVNIKSSFEDGLYKNVFTIYTTLDGQEFFKKSYIGKDFYEHVDQFSKDFQKVVYLDQGEQSSFIDLPAKDLYTSSPEALKKYALGIREEDVYKNREKGIALLKEAVEIDANFPNAYVSLAGAYQELGKRKELKEYLAKAMQQCSVLPERMQLNIKYFYYRINEDDKSKAISLLEMWEQLYPYDIDPYSRLINIYQNGLENNKAKEVGKRAIAAGHTGWILLRMGYIERVQGNLKASEAYYNQFLEEYPHRAEETYSLGWLYKNQGDLDKAKAYFEKIQLLNPTDHTIYSPLAGIEEDLGNMDKALELYEKGLAVAKIPEDSADIYQNIQQHYSRIGQPQKAIDLMFERFARLEKKFLTEVSYKEELLWPQTYYLYAECGKVRELHEMVRAYLAEFKPENEEAKCMSTMLLYLFENDGEGLRNTWRKCQSTYEKNASTNEIYLGQAFMAEANGDYESASMIFKRIVENSPDYFFSSRLVDIYLKMNEPDKAMTLIEKMYVEEPNYPKTHLQKARIYVQKKDKKNALIYVNKALEIWKDADECFLPVKEAKALKAELEG